MATPLTLRDTVQALLEQIPHLDVYATTVPTQPRSDPDGLVHPYAVLHTGPGAAHATRLCGQPRDLAWGCQVTAVGGDTTRCLWAVERVRGALTGTRVSGARGPMLTEALSQTRVQVDRDVAPPRFYAPLVYSLAAQRP